MEIVDILNGFNNKINDIYTEFDLDCINRLDLSRKIHEKQMLSWHSEVTRKCQISNNFHFDYSQNYDDLSNCSNEVLYFVAHLYLYRPYMNSPIEDKIWFSTRMIYPNYVNLGTTRYYMFADVVSEKLYNFWDRIGDLIASFYPELIKESRVYFPTAFDIIPKEYHTLESYQWLKNFRETSYKDLNNKRKEIVHYTTSITSSKWSHLKLKSEEEIRDWLLKRDGLADYYKAHIDYTIEGFYQTLLLLEEIDRTKYKDVILPQ